MAGGEKDLEFDNVKTLDTGYRPVVQPVKDVVLPLELRNRQGEVIASIWYREEKKTYYGTVNFREVAESRDFSECLTMTFGWLYQEMQNYRKVAEKHGKLMDVMRECLSTPWNKL